VRKARYQKGPYRTAHTKKAHFKRIPERPTFGSHILDLLSVNSTFCVSLLYVCIYSFYHGHGLFILFILNLLLPVSSLASFLSHTCSFFSTDFDWELMVLKWWKPLQFVWRKSILTVNISKQASAFCLLYDNLLYTHVKW